MTPGDQQRSEDEAPPIQAQDAADKTPPAAPDPKKPAGLNYVFKFAPADPKNSFDFEDVADK
jgi:hypothetical protein